MKKTVTIKMNEVDAYALGLLRCKCLHHTHNHFQDGKGACAHCKCTKYREVAVPGEIVSRGPMAYRRGDVMMARETGNLGEVWTADERLGYTVVSISIEHGHNVLDMVSATEIDERYEKIGRV